MLSRSARFPNQTILWFSNDFWLKPCKFINVKWGGENDPIHWFSIKKFKIYCFFSCCCHWKKILFKSHRPPKREKIYFCVESYRKYLFFICLKCQKNCLNYFGFNFKCGIFILTATFRSQGSGKDCLIFMITF